MPALAQHHLFTIDEYTKMAETGILTEKDRVELIQGEIIEISPIGSRHAASVNRLNRLLAMALGERAVVSVQNPVRLDDFSEPEPDVTLLEPRDDFYAAAHAGPADILLLIEVSDSSLLFDREVKLPLYALHKISELWVVNLIEDLIEVHREPRDGVYQAVSRLRRGDRLAPEAFPDIETTVESILG